MFFSQGDADPAVKLEFDDDGLAAEGGTGENSVSKPKAPRVKKEPGRYSLPLFHQMCSVRLKRLSSVN